MSKTMMAAAFAAIITASPMALTAHPASAAAPATGVTANRVEPGQIVATDLKGADVYDTQNKKVGSIKDLILDRNTGKLAAVVLDVDGKYVGVAMQDLKIAMNDDNKPQRITVDMSQNLLKSAETFQLDKTTAGSGSSNRPGPTTMPPANHKK